jgi:hypothetical protein
MPRMKACGIKMQKQSVKFVRGVRKADGAFVWDDMVYEDVVIMNGDGTRLVFMYELDPSLLSMPLSARNVNAARRSGVPFARVWQRGSGGTDANAFVSKKGGVADAIRILTPMEKLEKSSDEKQIGVFLPGQEPLWLDKATASPEEISEMEGLGVQLKQRSKRSIPRIRFASPISSAAPAMPAAAPSLRDAPAMPAAAPSLRDAPALAPRKVFGDGNCLYSSLAMIAACMGAAEIDSWVKMRVALANRDMIATVLISQLGRMGDETQDVLYETAYSLVHDLNNRLPTFSEVLDIANGGDIIEVLAEYATDAIAQDGVWGTNLSILVYQHYMLVSHGQYVKVGVIMNGVNGVNGELQEVEPAIMPDAPVAPVHVVLNLSNNHYEPMFLGDRCTFDTFDMVPHPPKVHKDDQNDDQKEHRKNQKDQPKRRPIPELPPRRIPQQAPLRRPIPELPPRRIPRQAPLRRPIPELPPRRIPHQAPLRRPIPELPPRRIPQAPLRRTIPELQPRRDSICWTEEW